MLLQFLKDRKKKSNIIIALDMMDTGIALVVLTLVKQEKPSIQYIKYCAYTDVIGVTDALALLQSMLEGYTLPVAPCVALLNMDEYHMMLLDKPKVDDSELKDALAWNVRELMEFDEKQGIFDYFDLPEIKGRNAQLYVVLSNRECMNKYTDILSASSLNLHYLDIPEMAHRNISNFLDTKAQGVAILRLYENKGIISVVQNGILFLARHLNIGLSILLRQYDNTDVIRPVYLDELVLEIQRSLDYYISHFRLSPVTRLYIAPIPGTEVDIADYLHTHLGLQVSIVNLNAFCSGENVSSVMQYYCFDALGAALRYEATD